MEPARNTLIDKIDVHDALERAAELLRVHDELQARAAEDADEPRHPALVQDDIQRQVENLEQIRALLDPLHPADVAYILEALPLTQRLVVWDLVKADRRAGGRHRPARHR
jgi:magnesium transporter